MSGPSDQRILDEVSKAFSAKALNAGDIKDANKVAQAFGYTEDQLQAIPPESNMGLSCGNPTAIANLKEGEVVLDLGSGGGIDVLLAATKVGSKGQVVGLDMSADMVALARRNASKKGLRPPQVAYVQASFVDPLPVESASVDCILSNCVINLLPPSAKAGIFKECFRVLKPGGRLVVDDILAKKPLPEEIRQDLSAYVDCISGAITHAEYETLLADAGLSDIQISRNAGDFKAYKLATATCCKPKPTSSEVSATYDPDDWVESCHITAAKPGTPPSESPAPLLRWWDAYPVVQSKPSVLPADEVAAALRSSAEDYAIIDVRRADYTGHCVKDSHQWPAQSFFDDLPSFYEQFKDTPRVVFYCGSSAGRGPRSAGWYQDYLNSQGCSSSQAYVLEGGIKGWVAKFGTEAEVVQKI